VTPCELVNFTDGLEGILVSVHTVHDFLYPEDAGSKLAQYTSHCLATHTAPRTGRAESSPTPQLEPYNPPRTVYIQTVTMHSTQ
jgi:hypothetical protein